MKTVPILRKKDKRPEIGAFARMAASLYIYPHFCHVAFTSPHRNLSFMTLTVYKKHVLMEVVRAIQLYRGKKLKLNHTSVRSVRVLRKELGVRPFLHHPALLNNCDGIRAAHG